MNSHGRGQFAAELRRLRQRAGLSLGELAGLAHVNRGYVGHIEHGQRWPSRSVATALDDALDALGAADRLDSLRLRGPTGPDGGWIAR